MTACEASLGSQPTQAVIDQENAKGSLAFVAYPQEFHSWEANNYAGVEVYNLYTNTKKINYLLLFFDGLWSYRGYPELSFQPSTRNQAQP